LRSGCDGLTQWEQVNFGKLNLSWTGGGTNSTRLSNWLDPKGINTTGVLDGISHCKNTTVSNFQYGNPKIIICEVINVLDATVPTGNKLILQAKEENIFFIDVHNGGEYEMF